MRWLIVSILLCLVPLSQAAEKTSAPLTAGVRLNARSVSEGQSITITGTVINTSNQVIRVFNRRMLYATQHVKLSDHRGVTLPSVVKVFGSLARPSRDNFTELTHNAVHELIFTASLRRAKILDVAGGPEPIEGVFLEFDDSAILVPHTGEYYVEFEVRHHPEVINDIAHHLGLQNVWSGAVKSQRIALDIRMGGSVRQIKRAPQPAS